MTMPTTASTPTSSTTLEPRRGPMGFWREPLEGVKPGASITWQPPGQLGLQVWVGTIDGRAVARISRQPAHGKACSAAISGWMWTAHQRGSLAERIGRPAPVRGFDNVVDAKRAIQQALNALHAPSAD